MNYIYASPCCISIQRKPLRFKNSEARRSSPEILKSQQFSQTIDSQTITNSRISQIAIQPVLGNNSARFGWQFSLF
jgi:hypothetical protein